MPSVKDFVARVRALAGADLGTIEKTRVIAHEGTFEIVFAPPPHAANMADVMTVAASRVNREFGPGTVVAVVDRDSHRKYALQAMTSFFSATDDGVRRADSDTAFVLLAPLAAAVVCGFLATIIPV